MFKFFRFRLFDQDGRIGKIRPVRDSQFIWVQEALQVPQGRELGVGMRQVDGQVSPPESVADQTADNAAFDQESRRLDGLQRRAQIMDRRAGTRIDQGKGIRKRWQTANRQGDYILAEIAAKRRSQEEALGTRR